MQLNDRDINALKGIIDTAKKHKDHNMAYLAAEKNQKTPPYRNYAGTGRVFGSAAERLQFSFC
jgi:hypothetical protein